MNPQWLVRITNIFSPRHRGAVHAHGLGTRQTLIPLGIIGLLLVLSAATMLIGSHHVQNLTEAYSTSVVNQLEAISELKKGELMQWRKERLGDAKNLQGNVELTQAAERALLHKGDAAARQAVLNWLRLSYYSYGEYDSICLFDAAGHTVVTTLHQDMPSSATFRSLLLAGKDERGVRFLDFYRDEHDGQIYCAVAYAVFDRVRGGEAIGFVTLHMLAEAYIYPLIRKWPTSSMTGETVIVRRDGPVVRFLSTLRQDDNASLDYSVPVERLDSIAVQAALGQHGIARGRDHRGVPVVAALTTLPDGSWSMVTKVAQSEVESEMSERVRAIGFLVAALSLSIAVGSLAIWKLHRSIVAQTAMEAENKLSRSAQQFSNLMETMTQGLVKIDTFGAVTYANEHFLNMLGRRSEEVAGRDIALHAADQNMRDRLCAREGCLAGGDCGFEAVWLNGEGNKVFSMVTPVCQPGDSGNCDEKWLLILDTTRWKFMEAQLLQSQKLEAIGQLAAGIAHEINTPAQYVSNNVQFLKVAFEDILAVCGKTREFMLAARDAQPTQEDVAALGAIMAEHDVEYLETEVPGAIAQTMEGIERISTIVRSVKQFAHPTSMAMSSADLNEAMLSTVTVSRNEWKYVAELETDLDPNLPLVICMIGEINQVVLNLIINAAHAISDAIKIDPERKGRITLSTKFAAPWAEIRVSDTGTGIPPAVQAKIFDPFFTTKEVGRGTGQGLTISRSIVVEKHRGQLYFETEPGVGTTFVVRLPLGHSEVQKQ